MANGVKDTVLGAFMIHFGDSRSKVEEGPEWDSELEFHSESD